MSDIIRQFIKLSPIVPSENRTTQLVRGSFTRLQLQLSLGIRLYDSFPVSLALSRRRRHPSPASAADCMQATVAAF
jgi:hypothetical protein